MLNEPNEPENRTGKDLGRLIFCASKSVRQFCLKSDHRRVMLLRVTILFQILNYMINLVLRGSKYNKLQSGEQKDRCTNELDISMNKKNYSASSDKINSSRLRSLDDWYQ